MFNKVEIFNNLIVYKLDWHCKVDRFKLSFKFKHA